MSAQDVQRSVLAVLDLLQSGQEDQAVSELRRVLQSDPNNRIAQSLLRQVNEDAVSLLGNQSYPYRVKPGESLSLIAQRYMNDVHMFYALAKYNGIRVPRNLAGGQVIRLPGKGPPPGLPPVAATASPPGTPSPSAAGPGTSAAAAAAAAATAANLPASAAAPAPNPADQVRQEARQRAEAVARHTRAARTAFARQDLESSLRSWDAVLQLEPDNSKAKLERQKVADLQRKLEAVK